MTAAIMIVTGCSRILALAFALGWSMVLRLEGDESAVVAVVGAETETMAADGSKQATA